MKLKRSDYKKFKRLTEELMEELKEFIDGGGVVQDCLIFGLDVKGQHHVFGNPEHLAAFMEGEGEEKKKRKKR